MPCSDRSCCFWDKSYVANCRRTRWMKEEMDCYRVVKEGKLMDREEHFVKEYSRLSSMVLMSLALKKNETAQKYFDELTEVFQTFQTYLDR